MRINALAGLQINRQSEWRDDDRWVQRQLDEPSARFIPLSRVSNLIHRSTLGLSLPLLRRSQLPLDPASATQFAYLGTWKTYQIFTIGLTKEQADSLEAAADAHSFTDLRMTAPMLEADQASLGAYARGIAYWQHRHRFCGVCGERNRRLSAGFRMKCTQCGASHFPRVDPAMIVAVHWQDQILLGRQASWDPGRYSTLAGFVEPGESLEDAVIREVAEESGVKVASARYHSSQPWPFPSSLMVGFLAEAASPDLAVGDELEDARWFSLDDIKSGLRSGALRLPPPLSISHRLIEHWLASHGVTLAEWKLDKGW